MFIKKNDAISLSQLAMVLTKLLLYNVRKLSCKFQLLWASDFSEEDFRNIFPK
jgi:hypothetical protein